MAKIAIVAVYALFHSMANFSQVRQTNTIGRTNIAQHRRNVENCSLLGFSVVQSQREIANFFLAREFFAFLLSKSAFEQRIH